MTNFKALAKQHAAAKPKTVTKDSYKAANNPPASCPAQSDNWKVSSEALPPVPDKSFCECMVKSLSCVPKSSLDNEDFGSVFDYVCDKKNDKDGQVCAGIAKKPDVGVYGTYSMCDDRQKLAYVMDAWYKKGGKKSSDCDFEGKAQTQTAESKSTCSDQLKEADDHNKKVATASSASDAPATTGGSSSGKEDEPGFGIRSAPLARVFSIGDVAVGLYMVVAVGVGAGMAML